MKMNFRLPLIVASLFISYAAFAGRTVTTPPIHVHHWVQTNGSGWCTTAATGLVQRYSVVLSNISKTTQTATLTATLLSQTNYGGAVALTPSTLDGSAVGNPFVKTITLAANQSIETVFGLSWYAPSTSGISMTHLISEYVIKVLVNEDRGAITGSYAIDIDNHCVNIINPNDIFGEMRNASQTYFINGGLPF